MLSKTTKGLGGLLTIFVMGLSLLTLHILHAFGSNENIRTFLFGILIPLGLAIAFLIGGVWLWQREINDKYVWRVSAWSVIGAVIFALGLIFVIIYQQAEGVQMSDQLYVVANTASGGVVVGFTVGIYDCRQRRARNEANRLNHQLSVLNRVLRHDIRNYAQVIQGNAGYLGKTETTNGANTIQQQAEEIVKLGDQARKISDLISNDNAQISVVEVESLIKTISEEVLREHPDSEIDTSLSEPTLVSAHPMIDSALRNVIENAVVHNDKQTPRVTIESVEITADGTDYIDLKIADNGPGIPDDEIDVIQRGYETDLEHVSGLGLWIVEWIIKRSGGEVRFEENDPEGSVVHLRFEQATSNDTSEANLSRGNEVEPSFR